MAHSSAESSKGKPLFCHICMEGKTREEMFVNVCSHLYCSDCISKHITTKIQENINSVTCPDLNCKRVFDLAACREFVPEAVFDKWMDALCESSISVAQKFYCPFKDCSALLVDDGDELVTQSECPNCRRLFCAQCRVTWHCGISCGEYRGMNDDDRKVMELAKQKNWGRCPSCKFLVEKKDGCQHITCRCRFQFCYGCGKNWSSSSHCSCRRA